MDVGSAHQTSVAIQLSSYLLNQNGKHYDNRLFINLIFAGTRLITRLLTSLQFVRPPLRNRTWRSRSDVYLLHCIWTHLGTCLYCSMRNLHPNLTKCAYNNYTTTTSMVLELSAHDNLGSGDDPVVLPEQPDLMICLMNYLINLQQPRKPPNGDCNRRSFCFNSV